MKYSISYSWLGAGIISFFYCFNLWLSVTGYTWISNLFVVVIVLFGFLILIKKETANSNVTFIIFLVSLLGFPEYQANPYIDGYISPFSFSKYAAIFYMVLLSKILINKIAILVFFLVCLSTIFSFFGGHFGNIQAEILYLFLFFYVLNGAAKNNFEGSLKYIISTLDRLFYCILPIVIFIYLLELYDIRGGGNYIFFFGHWVGFLTSLSVYMTLSDKSDLFSSKIIRVVLIIAVIYICLPSYQSSHFIFLMVTVFISVKGKIKSSKNVFSLFLPFLVLIILPYLGIWIISNSDQSSWIYLKFSQIFTLFSGDINSLGNSVIIRLSELISLIEQGGWFELFFGHGVASTFLAEGALWDMVTWHFAIYPEDQVLTGKIQYIHESVVMLFKWSGLLGLVFVSYILKKNKSIIDWHGLDLLLMLWFFFFFASSPQTAILVSSIYIFTVRKTVSRKIKH